MKRSGIAKLFSVLLCLTILFSSVGCGDNKSKGPFETPSGGNNNSQGEEWVEPPEPDEKIPLNYNHVPEVEGTIHEFSVGATPYYFIADGKCEYTIVYPNDAGDYIVEGARQFVNYAEEAFGQRIPSVTESEYEGGNFISLGNTVLAREANLTCDERCNSNGYTIKTEGKNIFVLGGGDLGVLYGAYELLAQLFGFEMFDGAYYSLNKNVTTLALPDINVVDSPDIEYRSVMWGKTWDNKTLAHAFRQNLERKELLVNDVHNAQTIAQWYYGGYAQCKQVHPKWYSLDGNQLCYTARGDKAEYQELVNAVAKGLEMYIDLYPENNLFTFTQMDVPTWCTCSECSNLKSQYGTDAVGQIRLINDAYKLVKSYVQENYPGREVTIAIFAYYQTKQPPVKKNADGTYEPIDETCVLDPDLAVMFAPIDCGSFTNSFVDSKNETFYSILQGWQACASKVFMWSYCTLFGDYLCPYNTWAATQDCYRTLVNSNTVFLFDQGQYNTAGSTGFFALKNYLSSKLAWNCNLSYEELVERYFKNVYGDASASMLDYFNALQTYLRYLEDVKGAPGHLSANGAILTYENWKKPTVLSFLKYVNQAYEDIAPLEAINVKRYKQIKTAIDSEAVFLYYALIKFHYDTYTESEKEVLAAEFKRVLNASGIGMWSEGQNILSIYNALGL